MMRSAPKLMVKIEEIEPPCLITQTLNLPKRETAVAPCDSVDANVLVRHKLRGVGTW